MSGQFCKFWMVLGASEPRCRHRTEESACKEAERLARYNPGTIFTVLEATKQVQKSDVAWSTAVEDLDIPF